VLAAPPLIAPLLLSVEIVPRLATPPPPIADLETPNPGASKYSGGRAGGGGSACAAPDRAATGADEGDAGQREAAWLGSFAKAAVRGAPPVERLEFDLLFRWFVGLSIDEKVFDASTFSKNRDRLLTQEVAQGFLSSLPGLPEVKGLLSAEHFSVDGTLLKAWASMKSFRPKDGSGEPPQPGRNGEANFRKTKRSNEPDAEKPVPLQVLALVLLHMSVADWPLGIERAKAERTAVGAGGVAACATAIASAVAGGERVVIGVAFDGDLELGDELTACPKTTSGKKSKPSLIVNTVKRTMRLYLKQLELDLTLNVWR
jgi:Transposase domain (DUF772)